MSDSSSDAKYLETARTLAHQAADAVMTLHQQPLKKERKADRSIVTEADLRSDEIIREGLRQSFPEHAILTEESGLAGDAASEYVWLIDPLDGTKAYAKGISGFSVMVGLLRAGEPYLGVVIDPLEGHAYEAIRGQGAFHVLNGKRTPLHVTERNNFSEMPLVISTGFPEEKLKTVRETLTGPVVEPINSVGIKVGLVVRQVGDIYISHHPVHYWDTAAPQIILEEAGGTFTRLDGQPLKYSLGSSNSHNVPTLATNGTRHRQLADLLSPYFE